MNNQNYPSYLTDFYFNPLFFFKLLLFLNKLFIDNNYRICVVKFYVHIYYG